MLWQLDNNLRDANNRIRSANVNQEVIELEFWIPLPAFDKDNVGCEPKHIIVASVAEFPVCCR